MPTSYTPPRHSQEHIPFKSVPMSETSASTGSFANGNGTPAGTSSPIFHTSTLTSILTSVKFWAVLAVLAIVILSVTLGVVFTQETGTPKLARVNDTVMEMSTPSSHIWNKSSPNPWDSSTPPAVSSTVSSTLSSSSTSSSTKNATIPTPTLLACLETEFRCNSGQCVEVTVLCDGIPHCDDGSDEGLPCACSSYQFTCANGQCVSAESQCNGVPDCIDKSDEMGCPDCPGFRCSSNDLCLWDKMERRCDNNFDCDDLSDEKNCVSKAFYKKCDNGIQIPRTKWCDGIDDCRDNSDEKSCRTCPNFEISCGGTQGKCISQMLRCDGYPDCDNGSDEERCYRCAADQFQCTGLECIPSSSHCDGKVDCRFDDSDEQNCFELDDKSILHVVLNGTSLPLCSDRWNQSHSSAFCSNQMKGSLERSVNSAFHAPLYALLAPGQEDIIVQNFIASSECTTGKVVRLRCKQADCGMKQRQTLQSFIAGGNLAPLGKWPWVAYLGYLNKPICGAAIIGPKWVLTAAHCVLRPVPGASNFTSVPFYFTVTAGSTKFVSQNFNLGNSSIPKSDSQPWNNNVHISAYVQTSRISKIYLHPKLRRLDNGGEDWDIALLQLSSEMLFTDAVQPLCLPSEDEKFPITSVCYTTGWGKLSHEQYLRADKLRDTRMKLWPEKKCKAEKILAEPEVNINSTICTGFFSGTPTMCEGDSGSPLMCLQPGTSRWHLAGIMSRGGPSCGKFNPRSLSNRFARVSTSTQWILNMMANNP